LTLGERIKKVRKNLDLTQQKFADQIGTTQNNIASYEIGRREPSAAAVNNICKTFNVSEAWLRTGEGEMFLPSPNGVLDELVQKYGLSTRGKVIVEKFLDLNPDVQEAVAVYIEEVAAAFSDAGTSAPVPVFAPADLRAEHAATESEDPELEAEVEAYRQRRLQEKRPGLQTSAAKGRGAV
jgi:transcriptional regulator with XRE-family HTH domain